MAVSLRLLWTPFVLLAVAGCSPQPPKRKAPANPEVPSPTASPSTSAAPSTAPSTAEPAAMRFLQAVGQGKVPLDQVSPAFLKLIAEPGILPSDIERGYDALAAKAWFEAAAGATYGPPQTRAEADGAAVFSGPITGKLTGHYAVRLRSLKSGWQVEWFQRLPGTAVAPASGNAFAAVAADCALGAMLGENLRLTAALLSPALLHRLGEPFPSDKERGYNVGALRTSLAQLTAGATGYTLTPAGANTYRVTLTGGTPRTLTLTLTPAALPGQWLVEDVQAK